MKKSNFHQLFRFLLFLFLTSSLPFSSEAQVFSTSNGDFPAGQNSTFTVPSGTTSIVITAVGGAGGTVQGDKGFGGTGATVSVTFSAPEIYAGDQLLIVPGEGGIPNQQVGGGGGGGSGIYNITTGTLLVIAGGGGGGQCSAAGNGGGGDATINTNSANGGGGTSTIRAGGGGGWLVAGADMDACATSGGQAAMVAGGGQGGATDCGTTTITGGFGFGGGGAGKGAGGSSGGGGGGGFIGGDASYGSNCSTLHSANPSTGGQSFVHASVSGSATATAGTDGGHTGSTNALDGQITLTVTAVTIPTMGEWALIIFGLVILSMGTVSVMRWKKTVAFG